MTRNTIVGIVGLLVAASISVAASWAQPRETPMLPGPATERLFQLAKCTANDLQTCKGKCATNDNRCIAGCEALCALENDPKPPSTPIPR